MLRIEYDLKLRRQAVEWRWLLTIVYGIFVIWTGLLRSIQAQVFKPNSFWFCLVTGLIAIAAGYCFRVGKKGLGSVLGFVAVLTVLSFYVNCFVTQPEKDATYRVGFVIIASIAALCVLTLPQAQNDES